MGQLVSTVDISTGDVAILIDAAVAQEGPPATHLLAMTEVEVYDAALFTVGRSAIEQLALGASHEGRAPELYARSLPAGLTATTGSPLATAWPRCTVVHASR